MPKRSGVVAGVIVGLERVHAVVLGHHVDDVVDALSRNRDPGQIERLSVDVAIHRVGKQLAELK